MKAIAWITVVFFVSIFLRVLLFLGNKFVGAAEFELVDLIVLAFGLFAGAVAWLVYKALLRHSGKK